MDRLTEIRDLYAYHRWANARVLDAASELDAEAFTREVESSFPSVQKTLIHMLAADWVWLQRWNGTSPTAMPDGWAGVEFPGLRTAWAELEAAQTAFVEALTEADLDRPLAYHNTAGIAAEQPLWQLLRHVVNHGTYHRGQVTTLLRQVGGTPPGTDLVLFHRR